MLTLNVFVQDNVFSAAISKVQKVINQTFSLVKQSFSKTETFINLVIGRAPPVTSLFANIFTRPSTFVLGFFVRKNKRKGGIANE